MEWQTLLTILFGIFGAVGTGFAIYFGVKSKGRNECKDSQCQGQNQGQIMTELGYIKGGIDDLKKDIRETKEEQVKMKIEIATLTTRVDNHIANRSIHSAKSKNN